MRRTNCRIGFDDRLVMVVLIPLMAFLIPIVFMGRRLGHHPEYTLRIYWTTLTVTTVLWLGNRLIMIMMRSRFPQFTQTRERLWKQSFLMLLFTLAATNTIGYLFKDYCGLSTYKPYPEYNLSDILITSNTSAIFCTLLVVAIYENVYFMRELRRSVEEKETLKQENLKAQLNALRTQVNPHFLFNNLNTLSSVIPENPQQAIDFVQQLSKVYRHILEMRDEQSIQLKEELDVLKAYAFLLKTRFGNSLDINIRVAQEKLQQKVVPLSLQILMENAIKHNIVSVDKPLTIDVFTEGGNLVVNNNLQKKKQLIESTGIGLENIRTRYKLVSEKEVEVKETDGQFSVRLPLL
ncbi:MAG: histidine kinase [Chitinophagaceae bacterium]|nr:histidine kinase [Chitinophagaceae bacterium]